MRRNSALYVSSVASSVLILDRCTKYIIIKNLSESQSIRIFPDIFHITLVLNKGLAFGLFKGEDPFFLPLSIAIISIIILYIWQNKSKDVSTLLALGFIVGGAIGNLIDRMRFGYVVDFLDFRIWPVFNFADSSITIGAIILAWNILRQKAKCTPSS